MPSENEIADFLRLQYRLWNEQRRDELTAAFKAIVPNKLIIEYVGSDPVDGWQALDAMWDQYGGKMRTDIVELIVNGNEAAVHIRNVPLPEQAGASIPSIETYRFDEGSLHVRYFHRASAT